MIVIIGLGLLDKATLNSETAKPRGKCLESKDSAAIICIATTTCARDDASKCCRRGADELITQVFPVEFPGWLMLKQSYRYAQLYTISMEFLNVNIV